MDTKEILNRRARHDFEVVETLEAGLALTGTEVKSLRMGRASLQGAFARVEKEEVWLHGAHVEEYAQGNRHNHEPKRSRKLLLHREEIRKLRQSATLKGLALVPLKMYFNARGYAKVLLGVCRGKTHADRRQDLRARDADLEIARLSRRR
ncbi:MAG: SsrA-binding protein SmpB [Verrucomicrobiae bacterium]|nr:SsrA-binding protein SmpB [Verrucomicrobiae bacterium]